MNRNPKPFWKEPTLGHVWHRANDGAKLLCKTFAFLVAVVVMSHLVSPWAGYAMLWLGIGFVFGNFYCEMKHPVPDEEEEENK